MHFSLPLKYIRFFISYQIGTVWRFVHKDIRPLFSCYLHDHETPFQFSIINYGTVGCYLFKKTYSDSFEHQRYFQKQYAYGCSKYSRLIQLFIHIANFTRVFFERANFLLRIFPIFALYFTYFSLLFNFFRFFPFFPSFFRKLNFNPHSHLFSAIDILDGYEI